MCCIQKLQRIQNNAVQIVLQMPKRSHAKPLLEKLPWLPVEQCIRYKMAVLTFTVYSMHLDADVSSPAHLGTSACSKCSSAVHKDRLYQVCFLLISSISVTHCLRQCLSVTLSTFKSSSKTFLSSWIFGCS